MKNTVFLNDQFLDQQDAQVSVFDRGFLFADGIYEVVPVIKGKLIDQAPFFERLNKSLEALSIDWPDRGLENLGANQQEQILTIFKQLIGANNIEQGGIYLQVTRGTHFVRDFAFIPDIKPTVMAFAFSKEIVDNPHAEKGAEVVLVDDIRWKRRDIKSIALLGQCMAKQQAFEQGAFEGWMVEDGFITEGTSSTAYIVKDNKIITRPLSNAVLPGVRRRVLLELCDLEDIELEQRLFTEQEALDADEAFITSATTLVTPVVKINGHQIGDGEPGSITKKARKLYLENIERQISS